MFLKTPPKTPPPLPEEFLAAEFSYIANSAFQANEDRSKAASFFLVSVGSLAAAIIGINLPEMFGTAKPVVYFLLAGLFALLTILGVLTLLQLVRLRLAWYAAAQAMNQMKDFFIAQDARLKAAFPWRSDTLKPVFKKDSIAFLIAVEVAIISALTTGAAVYFLQQGLGGCNPWDWIITGCAGATVGIVEMIAYKRLLK
jgi:hypothetical protein